MATIAGLRTMLNDELDAQALILGENEELSNTDKDTVSYGVDAKNETWNEDLPKRPHS